MSLVFNEEAFRLRVDSCLEKTRQILNSNRAALVAPADEVPHSYTDKYSLAKQLTTASGFCLVNCLKACGFSASQLVTLKECSKSVDISIKFHSVESCEFSHELSREVDSTGKYVSEVLSADNQLLMKTVEKFVTTETDYFYNYKVKYEIVAFRGVGDKPEDRMVISSREGQREVVQRLKSQPFPEQTAQSFDANVSWLFHNLSDNCEQMTFNIDRSHKDCHTPRRNKDIDSALRFFSDFHIWSEKVCRYLQVMQHNHGTPVQPLHSNIFVPVIPLLRVDSTFVNGGTDVSNETVTAAAADSLPAVVVAVPTATLQVQDPHTEICHDNDNSLPRATLQALLHEQERSLLATCNDVDAQFVAVSNVAVITAAEARITVICSHICDLIAHYFDGINFIEELIRKQLVSAVGKELQPSDFSANMHFHNRKLLRAEYQPKPFTHSVRRSVIHSPEGTVCIENTVVSGGGTASVSEPIYTVSHSSAACANNKMEFTLNAATTVKFGGDRHVHGWLAHSFSGQSLPQLNLVVQARQFSSFIVLVGSIASATVFQPKYAFIVQNKDEVVIPLLLETLPTPKQFRDAIESLSPEQQRFAKAFRSMQLESTLFGVCVIQIKPQLEKVLNLAPDSLTKELQLTQDLMKLFIEYQIPTDLMSFEGDRGASAATRLEAVRGHVKALNGMISGEQNKSLDQRSAQSEYAELSSGGFGFGSAPQLSTAPSLFGASAFGCNAGPSTGGFGGASTTGFGGFGGASTAGFGGFGGASTAGFGGFGGASTAGFGGFGGASTAGFGGFGGATTSAFGSSSVQTASPAAGGFNFSSTNQAQTSGGGGHSVALGVKASTAATPTAAAAAAAVAAAATTTSPQQVADSGAVHIVVNPPVEEYSREDSNSSDSPQSLAVADATGTDYTQIPSALDRNYDKYDCDSALKPTIIKVGGAWTKRSQAALLAKAASKTLHADEQSREKTAAFDLLDALSRSGALCIEDASLHVLIAATHSFDQSLMDTVVKGNVNPIERVERSTLIMASTLHGVSAAQLVAENQRDRVATYSPGLFVE